MIGGVIELAIGNLLLSLPLAILAYAVHRQGRYPALAHLLWVVVLLKVITPPLLTLPLDLGTPAIVSVAAPEAIGIIGTSAATAQSRALTTIGHAFIEHGAAVLVLTWVVGSMLVLAVSARRIRAFGLLLGRLSIEAGPEVQALASSVARELGMRSAPPIRLSAARLSPLTWWAGGRVSIVLPVALLDGVGPEEMRWVLAHELAHVKRRDYLVRWLEWIACVAFWWNPVVWFARRNLRLDEEEACDALVVGVMHGQPRSYAHALLNVAEVLAAPVRHAPAFATGLSAAGTLERRLTMIVAPGRMRQAPRWLVAGLVVAAMASMSVGIGSADASESDALVAAEAPTLATTGAVLAADVADESSFMPVSRGPEVKGRQPDFIGTPGDDAFRGTAEDELIVGRAGADMLSGAAGRDIVRGGRGKDTLRGGPGRDTLVGGSGSDTIDGGRGRDVIRAGAGDDIVRAWQDGVADRIDCGAGDGDRAIVDSADKTVRCEVVVLRDG